MNLSKRRIRLWLRWGWVILAANALAVGLNLMMIPEKLQAAQFGWVTFYGVMAVINVSMVALTLWSMERLDRALRR